MLFLFVRGGGGLRGGGGRGFLSLSLSNGSVTSECVSSYVVACDVYYNIIPYHVLDRISSMYNPQMQTILQKKKHFAIPSKPCVSD